RLGLRFADADDVRRLQERLQAEPGPCLEITDPDGNSWRFAAGAADDLAPAEEVPVEAPAAPGAQPSVWEHYILTPTPDRIPHDDACLDEVRLTGSFNCRGPESVRRQLAEETFRVLKPGGKVVVHGLMSDRPLGETAPNLPGLTSMVS